MSEAADGRTRGRRVRKVTATSLENAATHYLQRFSASSANLRRVLLRRIERARRAQAPVADDAEAAIEAIIAKFQRLKLIDDAAFAAGRAAALRRRGSSRRTIGGKLRLAGIDADGIAAAIEAADEELKPPAAADDDGPEAELRAALRLAQRRRLGPYRPEQDRAALRQRDLASLARAGFSLDIARRVIDASDPEAL
ncbi:MAG: RecX family transcriptional regulator [Reyranellaceae bacterium]